VDLHPDKVSNVEMGCFENDLAFGRRDGRLPLGDLPPRLPAEVSEPSEPQRRDGMDRLAPRPGLASAFCGWTACAPQAGVATRRTG